MATGFLILERREDIAHEISEKLGKFWIFASIMLFTLVGAQVDVELAFEVGLSGVALICCGLIARSVGVLVALIKSPLTLPERFFVVVSYWPKATVQAAIGAVPLMAMKAQGMQTGPGEIMLAVAVTSIVLTAPIGALAIKIVGKRVLECTEETDIATAVSR
jgi:NhaP-type Na+/H+ or K+/H+ antiporter